MKHLSSTSRRQNALFQVNDDQSSSSSSIVAVLTHSVITSPIDISKRDTGTITFTSKCPYPIWMTIVSQSAVNPWVLMDPGYYFPFSLFPPFNATDADGVSIKFGLENFTDKAPGPITQVELAWNSTIGSIVYDASDLNAYGPSPFYQHGYVLWADVTLSAEYPLCNTIHCGAGENPCTVSYWYGEPVGSNGESIANHIMTCPDTASLNFVVCSK